MTHIPKQYASDDDLDWFDLEKYADLERASLAQWGQLIRDRIWLESTIDGYLNPTVTLTEADKEGLRVMCCSWLESIKANPTKPLGFGRIDKIAKHPSNTVTVKLLTGKRLKWLSKEFDTLNPAPLIVDPGFAESPGYKDYPFANSVHLIVNLNATNEAIEKDFADLLRNYRKVANATGGETHGEKIKRWHTLGVMPYKDLCIFEKISGKSVRTETKTYLISPDNMNSPKDDEAKDRNLRKQVGQIFSQEVCELLENSGR